VKHKKFLFSISHHKSVTYGHQNSKTPKCATLKNLVLPKGTPLSNTTTRDYTMETTKPHHSANNTKDSVKQCSTKNENKKQVFPPKLKPFPMLNEITGTLHSNGVAERLPVEWLSLLSTRFHWNRSRPVSSLSQVSPLTVTASRFASLTPELHSVSTFSDFLSPCLTNTLLCLHFLRLSLSLSHQQFHFAKNNFQGNFRARAHHFGLI